MVSLSNHEGNTASFFDKLRMRQAARVGARMPSIFFLLPSWEKVPR